MTTSTRLERNLPGILDDLAAGPAPEYLDDVFARTGRMRQRPGWTFPERWLPMADIARTRAFAPAPPWRLIAVALVLIALVLAALVVVGSQRKVAPPVRAGPQRRDRVRLGRRPVRRQPRYRCQPVACRRSRGRQCARLVAGRYPGCVPPNAGCCPKTVDIVTVKADGSDLRTVTSSPLATSASANWTPDSRHIAIIEYNAEGEGGHSSSSTRRAASHRFGWRPTWTCGMPSRSGRPMATRSPSVRSSTRAGASS